MYWLSFCDGDLPKGSQFLGVVIAPGNDLKEALRWCWRHEVNPGGEVGAVEISDDAPVPPEFRGILLQKDKIAELEAIMAKAARSPHQETDDARLHP